MSVELDCECGDPYDCEWYFLSPDKGEEFEPFQESEPCKCGSCKRYIQIGEDCIKFPCYNANECAVDENGEELDEDRLEFISYLCSDCGEQWLNLTDIGYCIPINENVMDYLREYQRITGFIKPEEEEGE